VLQNGQQRAKTQMALGLAFLAKLNAGLGNSRFGTFRM
jgi:hypothetical protein